MTLGKELPEEPGVADLGRALTAAVEALKARGKADFDNKTMLDVLGPVARHLSSGSASLASVRALASERAEATIPMKAIKGRASFLGERSIGHMDPGARSSQIMIEAVCDVLEGKA
jgi:dihydroxyacetone kinase-like protein